MESKEIKISEEVREWLLQEDSYGAQMTQKYRPALSKMTDAEKEEAMAEAMRLIYGADATKKADPSR